jgi:hypothetical protein
LEKEEVKQNILRLLPPPPLVNTGRSSYLTHREKEDLDRGKTSTVAISAVLVDGQRGVWWGWSQFQQQKAVYSFSVLVLHLNQLYLWRDGVNTHFVMVILVEHSFSWKIWLF